MDPSSIKDWLDGGSQFAHHRYFNKSETDSDEGSESSSISLQNVDPLPVEVTDVLERNDWFMPGKFLYNARVGVASLPGFAVIFLIGGSYLLPIITVTALIMHLFYKTQDHVKVLGCYIIGYLCCQFSVFFSILPLLWLSLSNIIAIISVNGFCCLTGAWGALQFHLFQIEDPMTTKMVETFLFSIYPGMSLIVFLWFFSSFTSPLIAPYLLAVVGFALMQYFLPPTRSSFCSKTESRPEYYYIIEPNMIAAFAVMYIFGCPNLVIAIAIYQKLHSPWPSFYYIACKGTELMFIGSLCLFLASFMHLRPFFEQLGYQYEKVTRFRWVMAVLALCFLMPVLRIYELSNMLPMHTWLSSLFCVAMSIIYIHRVYKNFAVFCFILFLFVQLHHVVHFPSYLYAVPDGEDGGSFVSSWTCRLAICLVSVLSALSLLLSSHIDKTFFSFCYLLQTIGFVACQHLLFVIDTGHLAPGVVFSICSLYATSRLLSSKQLSPVVARVSVASILVLLLTSTSTFLGRPFCMSLLATALLLSLQITALIFYTQPTFSRIRFLRELVCSFAAGFAFSLQTFPFYEENQLRLSLAFSCFACLATAVKLSFLHESQFSGDRYACLCLSATQLLMMHVGPHPWLFYVAVPIFLLLFSALKAFTLQSSAMPLISWLFGSVVAASVLIGSGLRQWIPLLALSCSCGLLLLSATARKETAKIYAASVLLLVASFAASPFSEFSLSCCFASHLIFVVVCRLVGLREKVVDLSLGQIEEPLLPLCANISCFLTFVAGLLCIPPPITMTNFCCSAAVFFLLQQDNRVFKNISLSNIYAPYFSIILSALVYFSIVNSNYVALTGPDFNPDWNSLAELLIIISQLPIYAFFLCDLWQWNCPIPEGFIAFLVPVGWLLLLFCTSQKSLILALCGFLINGWLFFYKTLDKVSS